MDTSILRLYQPDVVLHSDLDDAALGAGRRELFEASLALALAVADIAGRSGVKFETLFLDEGFAGLDTKNLDRAIDAIESQVTAGHSIILITHIGAVADRIPDVLYVQPTDLGGCTAEWLGDDEGHELGADLDLAIA